MKQKFKVILNSKNKDNSDNIDTNNVLELVMSEDEKKYSPRIRYNNYNFFVYNEKWIDTFKKKINLNEQLFFLDKNFYVLFKKISNKVLSKLVEIEYYLNFSQVIIQKYSSTHDIKKFYSNIHNNYCVRKKTYDLKAENYDYTREEYHFKIFEKLLFLSLSDKYSDLKSYNEKFLENKIKKIKSEFNLNPDEIKNIEICLYENHKYIFDFCLSEKLNFFSKTLIYSSKKINKIFTSFINLIKKNKEEIYGSKFKEIFDALNFSCNTRNIINEYINN